MKKSIDVEEEFYLDYQESMKEWWSIGDIITNPKTLENSWLYDKTQAQYIERDRLCVLLPLIRIEVENHMLSEELLDELELYYDDFNNGVFNDLFTEADLELIREDLMFSYENRMDNLYRRTKDEEAD